MSSINVKRLIINVIKRFKFEELEDAVIPIFPEISWTQVVSKLIKSHKTFTVTNVSYVIDNVINKAKIEEKILYDRLATLEAIEISRHSKKKTWYGYELINLNEARYIEKQEIQEIQNMIQDEFLSSGLTMNVKVVIYDNVLFISIKEKKKKKQVKRIFPTFFALFMDHKYFFCTKKIVQSNYLKVVTVSLGYNNYKKIKLMGRDLKSLMKLLWNKQQGALHAEGISQPPVYQSSNPTISNNGVDYTQSKQRRKYGEQCFGENPPTLEVLVIKGPEQLIQHESLISKLPDDPLPMSWEFRSHNIARFLTTLIEKRVCTPPVPDYISNFLTLGKNILTLRQE
ncbi:hypothetical protein PUN28_006008 [Cardiocondyla obscurior]|uniref:Uncharacterized protein n=1 Tax=Cardiocondyla obscurior TaxID=286306 RepID=A0AAW2GAB7_9HYME